jgi:hypothetical protein
VIGDRVRIKGHVASHSRWNEEYNAAVSKFLDEVL